MRVRTLNVALGLSAIVGILGPACVQQQETADTAAPVVEEADAKRTERELAAVRADVGLDELHTLTVKNALTDELGQTHTRVQQRYRGLRVLGAEAVVHREPGGELRSITNRLHKDVAVETTPKLSQEEAIEIVNADLRPGPAAPAPEVELVIRPEKVQVLRATGQPLRGDELNLNAEDVERVVERHVLAYRVVTSEHASPSPGMAYFVDALDGAILDKHPTEQGTNYTQTGHGKYYDPVSLTVSGPGSCGKPYQLVDNTRGGSSFNDWNNLPCPMQDTDGTWGDGQLYDPVNQAHVQAAGVDAKYSFQVTWDMFLRVFSRWGMTGVGSPVIFFLHQPNQNAHYYSGGTISLGEDGENYSFTSLDIIGHEFTHGVIENTSGLDSTEGEESAALNEGSADIFGELVESYAYSGYSTGSYYLPSPFGACDWRTATAVVGWSKRNMYRPSLEGGEDYWFPGISGAHNKYVASGPLSRAFVFLAHGASTVSTSNRYSFLLPNGMTGIGRQAAAKIWYRALTVYLTSDATYMDARIAAYFAANDLYGVGSAQSYAVLNAFGGVNVGSPL